MKASIFALFFLPLTLFSQVNGDGDFQIWNVDGMTLRLSPKSNFYGDVELRYGDHATKLYYKHIHFELNWHLNRFITLAPGFRFVYLRMNDKWERENDPLLKLTLALCNSPKLMITNRSWVQYRNLPKPLGGTHRFLYRNRLQCLLPPTQKHLRPYLSEEVFWQESRGVFENRITAGLLIPRHQRAFFDFSYTYRSLKNHENPWVHNNVFGAGVQFFF
jgi:hypothetical protein